jgi:hypothetical protein
MRSNRKKIRIILICIGCLVKGGEIFSPAQAEFFDLGLESTIPAIARIRQPQLLLGEGWQEIGASRTIERVSGEERGPRIPEPMVFDLVRPLSAKKGEWEVNTLALIPLDQKSETINEVADPSGLVRRSSDKMGIEWAPEIEVVLADGIALEFELPMEKTTLEAYKVAGQWTFGTAFRNRFIHGAQTIVQYNIDPKRWSAALLYLGGWRLDSTWSILGMVGARGITNGASGGSDVEILSNVTLFADLTERLVGGVETNFIQVVGGDPSLLIMPQLHYEMSKHWMVQAGGGAQFTSEFILPQLGFRLIREF